MDNTCVNLCAVCCEISALNEEVVSLYLTVYGNGVESNLGTTNTDNTGLANDVITVEEVEASPICSTGNGAVNGKRGTVVEVHTCRVVGDLEGYVLLNYQIGCNCLGQGKVQTVLCLLDNYGIFCGEDDLTGTVV